MSAEQGCAASHLIWIRLSPIEVPLVEAIAMPAREDMLVEVPDILVAGWLVVLARRNAVASVGLLERKSDAARRVDERATEVARELVEVLDVLVRTRDGSPVNRPPPGAATP